MERGNLSQAITYALLYPDLSIEAEIADQQLRAKPEPEPEEQISETYQGFEFDLGTLFHIGNTRMGMKNYGRLQGKHSTARLHRAKSKRNK